MDDNIIIRGYHGAIKYDKTFIQILYQNIKKGQKNLFIDKTEANYSLIKNKFSVLKYINDDFKINNVYEFIIYYKELDLILHWNQTSNFHVATNNIGYKPIHVDSQNDIFGGIGPNFGSGSYLDGQPNAYDWWYSIGCINLHKYNGVIGMPGPKNPLLTEVNITSLWIRINDFKILEKLPKLARALSCLYKRRYIPVFIFLISFINS